MIKKPKRYITLLYFILLLKIVSGNDFDYLFRVLNTEDGISSNQVNSIYKDHKGFLWIGTRNGLNRYDGYNVETYKSNPFDSTSIKDNLIRKIIGDKNDNLWILSPNSQLCIYDPVSDVFIYNLKQYDEDINIPQNNISDINAGIEDKVLISNDFFGVYIYDVTTRRTVWLKNDYNDPKSISSNNISSIKQNFEGDYWIVNRQGIIEKIDSETYDVLERKPIFTEETDEEGENFRLFIDKDNDVWVYSESNSFGAACYSVSEHKVEKYTEQANKYKIVNNVVKDIAQDSLGQIWVGMDHGGINIINKKTGNISIVKNIKGEINTLPDNSTTSIFVDNTGIVWVGMYKGGVAYHHKDFFKFKLYYNNPYNSKSISSNDINAFAEDAKGNVWIGSNGGGLIYFNRNNNHFSTYKHDPKNPNSLSKDVIISLLNDSKNRLWIGTYFGGLNLYENGNFKHYKHDLKIKSSLSNDRVWNIFEDSRGSIWIGTLGGGVDLYDPKIDGFVHYRQGDVNSIGSNYIFSIEEDKHGNVWFGTVNGIDVYEWQTNRFYRLEKENNSSRSLSDSKVIVIKKDSRGLMWIGTTDGLNLYDEKTKSFRVFRQSDGLPSNSILGIEEDDFGNIWVMSPMGLSEINVKDAKSVWDISCTFQNFNQKDGLEKQYFNERASLKTKSGDMLFGGIHGFNEINPSNEIQSYRDKNLTLLQFKLFNKNVRVGEEIGKRVLLDKTFQVTEEITLKYNENIFAISFTALDFFHPEKLVYEYRLDGFNDKWFRVAPERREATYTNLNSGVYYFRVRVSDDGKNWCADEVVLKINILPPVWATKWAYFSYIVIVIFLLVAWQYFYLKKERLKIKERNELEEVNRIAKLNELKFKFFTNVSHEFRTPLTLIISPIQKLISNTSDQSQIKQLKLIERNGKRLLSLVNQLLDFRKLEANRLKLNVSSGDIIRFVSEKTESFLAYSENKGVELKLLAEKKSVQVLFDHDKIEKIVFNLLSNAFKFTPRGGTVEVVVKIVCHNNDEAERMILIEVRDTGIGIAPSKINNIFDRFFQEDHAGEILNQGSGIGLSLIKEFVELHGGRINVESKLGEGSVFSVYIPTNIKEDLNVLVDANDETQSYVLTGKVETSDSDINGSDIKQQLLLVEDNEDLRYYLNEHLKEKYIIIEASDGQEALDLLSDKSVKPAIIISDVMMPVMNGVDLCEKLKGDDRFSHIPFVLLTAATSLDNELKGLEVGADDYITKPFNIDVLELKLGNIIAHKELLHSKFNSGHDISPSELCITSLDQKLFQKALDVVNENLADCDFSIDKMCELIGISRAHLYNKLVAITGKTPAEFIKIMRLKRSIQLIEQSQLSISEISYQVGYNGPRYFTKHFKDFYGQTPSQYSKSIKTEN